MPAPTPINAKNPPLSPPAEISPPPAPGQSRREMSEHNSDSPSPLSEQRGCLNFWRRKQKPEPEEERPRHRLRPVSSCTGRIKTILASDDTPVANSQTVDLFHIFKEYFPFMLTFRDELKTVPNIWLLMNYAYSRGPQYSSSHKGSPRQSGNSHFSLHVTGQTDSEGFESIHNNVRIVQHNFDIPTYLGEFTGAMRSALSPDELQLFSKTGMEWLQDPFFVMQTPEEDIAILDPHYIPQNYLQMGGRFLRPILTRRFLAREIAASEQAVLKPTPYLLEGGNILADQDFLVMGSDSFMENWITFHDHPKHRKFEDMQKQLALDFGVETILIPGLWEQPCCYHGTQESHPKQQIPLQHHALFHLDLFMGLGGYDPNSGKEMVFVAECWELWEGKLRRMPRGRIYCNHAKMGLNAYLDDIANWFANPPKYVHQAMADADLLADKRPRKERKRKAPRVNGFRVLRIPCFFDAASGETLYSFVNCHFENYRLKFRKTPIRRTYMPDYGAKSPDSPLGRVTKMAEDTYTAAGFEVARVSYGLEELISKGGSFHCMTKVIQRYPYDSSALMDLDDYEYVLSEDDKNLKKLGHSIQNLWNRAIRFLKREPSA